MPLFNTQKNGDCDVETVKTVSDKPPAYIPDYIEKLFKGSFELGMGH